VKVDIRKLPTYFINLEKDVDKYTSAISLLQYLEFDNVNRVDAIEAGHGCEKSHHKVLSDKSIPTPCLVLEDDILFTGNTKFELDVPDDADAIYIGASQWGRFLNFSGPFVHYKKIDDDLVRVYNMMTTHAIIYLTDEYRNFVSRVANYHGNEHPSKFDIGIAETQKYFNVYALDNPIFKQGNYNRRSTGISISEVGMDKEAADKFYKEKVFKLNELQGIPDKAGNCSHYSPITLL